VSKQSKSARVRPVLIRLPVTLQIGLHELIGRRWKATGQKLSQTQLFTEAVKMLLENEKVCLPEIDASVSKWEQSNSQYEPAVVTPITKKSKR